MKDIRLLELSDGRILVAVRPQGEIGGRGKIGFLVVKSLDELTKERMESAPVLEGQFVDEEMGRLQRNASSAGWPDRRPFPYRML